MFQPRPQMFQKVRQSSRAPAQGECLKWPRRRPPQPNRTGDNEIQVFHGNDALTDKIYTLPHEGSLKSVGDEPRNLLFNYNGALTNQLVEFDRGCKSLFTSPCS